MFDKIKVKFVLAFFFVFVFSWTIHEPVQGQPYPSPSGQPPPPSGQSYPPPSMITNFIPYTQWAPPESELIEADNDINTQYYTELPYVSPITPEDWPGGYRLSFPSSPQRQTLFVATDGNNSDFNAGVITYQACPDCPVGGWQAFIDVRSLLGIYTVKLETYDDNTGQSTAQYLLLNFTGGIYMGLGDSECRYFIWGKTMETPDYSNGGVEVTGSGGRAEKMIDSVKGLFGPNNTLVVDTSLNGIKYLGILYDASHKSPLRVVIAGHAKPALIEYGGAGEFPEILTTRTPTPGSPYPIVDIKAFEKALNGKINKLTLLGCCVAGKADLLYELSKGLSTPTHTTVVCGSTHAIIITPKYLETDRYGKIICVPNT